MSDENKYELIEKTYNVILLCLSNKVFYKITEQGKLPAMVAVRKFAYNKVSYKLFVFEKVIIHSQDERRYIH